MLSATRNNTTRNDIVTTEHRTQQANQPTNQPSRRTIRGTGRRKMTIEILRDEKKKKKKNRKSIAAHKREERAERLMCLTFL